MWTNLGSVEAFISEKVSVKQSNPNSDSCSVFGPDSLPSGSIPSASLTLSKVPCKDKTHTRMPTLRGVFFSEWRSVRWAVVRQKHGVLSRFCRQPPSPILPF